MHPGEIIAGKYRVANILGRHRGLLVEAFHTEFDQHVVMRLLSPAICDEKQLAQFRREATTLSKLESEHVARLLDVGTHSDGSFFLVRQYLDGIDLATHIKNQGALRVDEAVMYTLQAAEALQECHSHNILIRELQPAHLFITRKRGGIPAVKITDFGTAKVLKDPAAEAVAGEMTATVMFGMSPYSSPELVRKARDIDVRTDVWSLGCILYEMLAAVPPFQGEMAELMLKITREDPIPLSNLRPDLPREFDQIMGWALAKDRNARFSSIYAFAHALKPYASTEGQVLIDHIGRLAHAKPVPPATPSKISPTSPLAKRPHAKYSDDDATVIRQVPGYDDENEFEKTAFFGDGRGSVPPPPGSYSGHGSVPPPPGSYSGHGSVPPPPGSYSGRGSVPPPPSSHAGLGAAPPSRASAPGSLPSPRGSHPGHGSVPPPRSPQGSWVEADPAVASVPLAPAGEGFHASTSPAPKRRGGAIIAIAIALVLLPVAVVAGIFAFRTPAGDATVAANETPTDSAPSESDGPAVEEKAAGGAAPEPAATSEPVADEGDAPPDAEKGDGAGGGEAAPTKAAPPPAPISALPKPPPKSASDDKAPAPKPAPKEEPPPPPPSSGGETGTLVAIAIGGTCAFAVNGAPKGTQSSIRVTVPVGQHTVSCTPPNKAPRSQRVNVKPGKPGIASFRLN